MKKLTLLVMPEDRRRSLVKCLEGCAIEVLPASDCREARRVLQTNPGVQILLTDVALPDGNWADLTAEAERRGTRTEVIICMRMADPMLWIDVLERGAYDVLVEPFHEDEVKRIVNAAAAKNRIHPWPVRRPVQSASEPAPGEEAVLCGG